MIGVLVAVAMYFVVWLFMRFLDSAWTSDIQARRNYERRRADRFFEKKKRFKSLEDKRNRDRGF